MRRRDYIESLVSAVTIGVKPLLAGPCHELKTSYCEGCVNPPE